MYPYVHRLDNFQKLTALLIESADEEAKRLEATRARLLRTAHIVPLEVPILETASHYQIALDLSPQDALVYTSVIVHLQHSNSLQSCFLNRNSKDFDDPELVEELNNYNCKLLPHFNAGYQFILSFVS
jgi:hypothetical protein